MKFIADFHIHSHFSVATSRNLVPEHLEYWARIKGINVLGTGDCIHPGWYDELKEKLEPEGNGLYLLKKEYRLKESRSLAGGNYPEQVHFMLTGEISSIYKKNGRVRKVHNLCFFPDFESALKMQSSLDRIGNIRSDGRPILGLDSRILLEMLLTTSQKSFLVPAHIWTPWFSVLGSNSGFDSIEECFDDLTGEIFAVETGLSSDPPMNRACGILDRFKLISNSDAHSPEKLGREANVFDCEMNYNAIYGSLKGDGGLAGTIEFYPQEGKYHYDGHRKCGVKWDPLETVRHNGVCTTCGRPVTKGVMYRVAELADRTGTGSSKNALGYSSITPMPDLISEILGHGSTKSKSVQNEYMRVISALGSEFHIQLEAPIDEIEKKAGLLLSEGIKRLREGNVIIEEGYDGEFGRIKVFLDSELRTASDGDLFGRGKFSERPPGLNESSVKFDINEFKKALDIMSTGIEGKGGASMDADKPAGKPATGNPELSAEQLSAVEYKDGNCIVIAGPGSGKTRVLVEKILHLTDDEGVRPGSILAVTFSNKAAQEIRDRLKNRGMKGDLEVATFHSFGLGFIKKNISRTGRKENFIILDDEDRTALIGKLFRSKEKPESIARRLDLFKQGSDAHGDPAMLKTYEEALVEMNAFDFGDLVSIPVKLLGNDPDLFEGMAGKFSWVLIDEFQDINAVQFEFIRLLSGNGRTKLFAIGDRDQAIYGFRGSDPKYIDLFIENFSPLVVTLGKSYRCPDPLLKIAGQVLNKDKTISGLPSDIKAEIIGMSSDRSEADWIAAKIESMMGGVRSFSMDSGMTDGHGGSLDFSDFCVLCRGSFMFDPIVEAFNNHGISYQVIGGRSFLSGEPYRTAVRIMTESLRMQADCLPPETTVTGARRMMDDGASVIEIMRHLLKNEITTVDYDRLENTGKKFGNDYPGFIRSCSTRQGIDDYEERSSAVSLMTMHASKGLEFTNVFIPGCEDGIIPFELYAKKTGEELIEEERLFYVGITRAKMNLFLTYASRRTIRNRRLTLEISRFIGRMCGDLIQSGMRTEKKKRKTDEDQLDLFK
ncbi:MAG: UvrD-helicase domain-containing protein [Spirochaetes bacterium]|nr:UvrD-helicase domain-containing protein [Spirochaetota bacterium]